MRSGGRAWMPLIRGHPASGLPWDRRCFWTILLSGNRRLHEVHACPRRLGGRSPHRDSVARCGARAVGRRSLSRRLRRAARTTATARNMHLLSTAAHTGGVNSDLAFSGNLVFAGHYGGFRIIDISDPGQPVEMADVHCNGPQGDVSVWGDLLFLSVDTPQSTPGCEGSRNVTATTPGAWEGVRVFDVSDPSAPRAPGAGDPPAPTAARTPTPSCRGKTVGTYIYVASYPLSASNIGPGLPGPVRADLGDRRAGWRCRRRPRREGRRRAPPSRGSTSSLALSGDWVSSPATTSRCSPRASSPPRPACPRANSGTSATPGTPGDREHRHSSGGHLAQRGVHPRREARHVRRRVLRSRPPTNRLGRSGRTPSTTPSTPLSHLRIPRDGRNTYHNFNYVPVAGRNILVSSAYGSGTSVVDLTDPKATPRRSATTTCSSTSGRPTGTTA